ncbi:hypothetical protein BEWA_015540 [Theileria equi strain WA]|uniref:Guanylate cyclase domain-containing protein n=1 Tax=Theileria equi strain WA TaxID=1537102 RepID=L1LCU5_THEEQ|nr:hypothetical protein BEWA_015540 [Theileria equi strain WA]EKX72993.1 hypothetical protein BEWA_015540 [Theileria equi strain WA]|eukprot:XP_004832445.1 hypothetical protein BEWA_015540 [Theileria equi strain WA]
MDSATNSIFNSVRNCPCISRYDKGEVDVDNDDYFDVYNANKDEERLKDDWRWLSIRCERRLNEKLTSCLSNRLHRLPSAYKESTATPEDFASFVPRIIREYACSIDEQVLESGTFQIQATSPLTQIRTSIVPSVDLTPIFEGYAPVVFCDVSGFTSLAEAVEDSGDPDAAATLGKCLNEFFDPLISIIYHWGGDIMKFSGDAVLAVWKGHDLSNEQMSLLALKCCHELHKVLHEFPSGIDGRTLSMHIGASFGKISIFNVGGVMNHWEYVISGIPLREIAIAEPLAESGETVISASILKCAETEVEVTPIDGNTEYYVLKSVKPLSNVLGMNYGEFVYANEHDLNRSRYTTFCMTESISNDELTPKTNMHSDISGESTHTTLQDMRTLSYMDYGADLDVRTSHVPIFGRYMPEYIYNRLISGYNIFHNEMRNLTTIFVSVTNFDISSLNGRDVAQQIMVVCQKATYAVEGVVNKLLVDDKGLMILIFMGFPPYYHVDDPVRSVFVAFKIASSCKRLGLDVGIGISTGRVWCGTLGNDLRKEYTALGDHVNLSCRLMSMGIKRSYEAAKNDSENVKKFTHPIFVDENTYLIAQSSLGFEYVDRIKLKGKDKLVNIYTPTGKVVRGKERLKSPLESWKSWKMYKEVSDKLDQYELLRYGGIMTIFGNEGSEMQAYLKRKLDPYIPTISVSTIRDSEISIATDSKTIWKSLCTELVDKWASSEHRRKMLTLHNRQYYKSHNCVSKKGVTALVKELLDPSLHWNMGVISHLIDGLESESTIALIKGLSNKYKRASRLSSTLKNILGMHENADSEMEATFDDSKTSSFSDAEIALLERSLLDEPISPFILSMIQGFLMHEKLCIILNMQRGTSVEYTIDDESWNIVLDLARLATDVRKQVEANCGSTMPIIFILIAPNAYFLRAKDLLEIAKERNSVVKMKRLNKEETGELISHCLNVADIPDELVEHIYTNTSGMPQFVCKSVQRLLDEGHIKISTENQDASMEWSPEYLIYSEPVKASVSVNLENVTFIDEMRSFAMTKIDRLQPNELFIAKVANMLPEPFSAKNLLGRNPKMLDDAVFIQIVESLLNYEVLEIDGSENMDVSLHTKLSIDSSVQFKIANMAIKSVISERILEDERTWIKEHFV